LYADGSGSCTSAADSLLRLIRYEQLNGGYAMKTKIQVVIAVLVMIAAGYWGYTALRTYDVSGSNIMFRVGAGHVVVTNPSDAPIPIEMRSGERVASFRVASTDLDLRATSRRQGTGRDAFHAVNFDLPPGQTRVDIVSGSDVRMVSRSETPIQATVTPMAPGTVRWTLILSGGVIVWALYYMSSATGHRWISALRSRKTAGALEPKQTTT
jgi:hypothetical protein